MNLGIVRPIDRARAAQLVASQITGDTEMFATAVHATLEDDYGLNELGSLINVLRVLSEDLATSLSQAFGANDAATFVRSALAEYLAEAAEE